MAPMPFRQGFKAAAVTTALGVAITPLGLLAPASATTHGLDGLIINEVYGGGGNSGATYTHDFIELYNSSAEPVSLDGLSVQYRSSTGSVAVTAGNVFSLSGVVPAGGYWLVQAAQGNGGTTPLPAPDNTSTLTLSGTAGQVFLASTTSALSPGSGDMVGKADVVDMLGWGSATTSYETAPAGGTANTTSVARTVAGVDTDSNAADFTVGAPTPQGSGVEPPPPATCGDPEDPISLISDIQGSGASFDPDCSGTQTVEAVVTAIKPRLNGFYLQEEAADSDGDETTSEGIFVFAGSAANIPAGLDVGDGVRVAGTVGEFTSSTGAGSSQTQLSSPTITILEDVPLAIEATPLTFPLASATTLEQYEGMLVELTDTLVISEYFNYDRFGEVVLAKPLDGQDRLHTPTAVVEPGAEAQALLAEYNKRKITLDDYNGSQNPATVPHPGNGEPYSKTNTFRGGDTVTGVEGVIDHTFGLYRIQPTEYGAYGVVNTRPAEAPEVGGSVSVASFNVLNYFLTLDDGPAVCGANASQDCRGANTAAELERQRTKILAAMAELDADVFGLMEMENTPGVEPAADLAEGLNDLLGEGTYDYIDTGVIGTDAIRLGYLYKPGALTPVGEFEVLDSSDDSRFVDTANRPMLTQTFDEVATGERFTLSINHLKSKGSACSGDPDLGDGAGNCNVTRTEAAKAIVDFLEADPTGSGDPDHLVIGDLNSYDHEAPIDVLVDAGYTDLVKKFGGDYAYGYVFDGMVGYLDHALSNETLTSQVTGAAEWHINADEPDILDYNLDFGRSADLYSPDAYRSSDHDPVLVGLALDDGTDPTDKVESSLQAQALPFRYGRTGAVDVTVTADEMPTGTVEVRKGDRLLGTGELTDGKTRVLLEEGSLMPGHHVLTVTYLGDDAVEPSESTTQLQVLKVKPGMNPKVGPKRIVEDRTEPTVTVRVVAQGAKATGKVTMRVGKRTLAVRTLRDGMVRAQLPAFATPGSKTIVVRYAGSKRVRHAIARIPVQVKRR